MKKTLFALLTIITTLILSGVVWAEITTVFLSKNTDPTFTVSADNDPKDKETLEFIIEPVVPEGASVSKCTLRVVPTPLPTALRADQDVIVLLDKKPVGQWSAYSKTSKPYVAELRPKACASGSHVFTLKTESKFTDWEYYGGKAKSTANQPRLIVTYDTPTPAHSGQTTDWKYEQPTSFFFSRLFPLDDGKELLANPVSNNGAVFVVAACPKADGRCLYRLVGAGKVVNWPLAFEVEKESFAFVTDWDRLQLITKDAIHSCNLAIWGSADKLLCDHDTSNKITVKSIETPAMGPDGSLYFRNEEDNGSIVALNPTLQEIWRTELKLESISPITLSVNGRYAYLLADIPKQQGSAAKMIALLRIDTATGETVKHEIYYCPEEPASCKEDRRVKPLLQHLLRPAVASKTINMRNVDYVFVAGNKSDTGILQLVALDQSSQAKVVWTRHGKIATAPVLSAKDGNTLVVVQGDELKRYTWYNSKSKTQGAYSESGMKVETLQENMAGVTNLLADGGDTVYIYADKFMYAYQNVSKKMPLEIPKLNLLFTPGGALIGYNNSKVYDLSPKVGEKVSLSTFANRTIYSADTINVAADAGKSVKKNEQVILKGSNIALPNGFRWPWGATLTLQSMQQTKR